MHHFGAKFTRPHFPDFRRLSLDWLKFASTSREMNPFGIGNGEQWISRCSFSDDVWLSIIGFHAKLLFHGVFWIRTLIPAAYYVVEKFMLASVRAAVVRNGCGLSCYVGQSV